MTITEPKLYGIKLNPSLTKKIKSDLFPATLALNFAKQAVKKKCGKCQKDWKKTDSML
jgi:hypothetical protein